MLNEDFKKSLEIFKVIFESEELIAVLNMQALSIQLDVEDEGPPLCSEVYRNVRIGQSRIDYYLKKLGQGALFNKYQIAEVTDFLKELAKDIDSRSLSGKLRIDR